MQEWPLASSSASQDLERLRQVHGALGRDTGRVQRVYLAWRRAAGHCPIRMRSKPKSSALLLRRSTMREREGIARALGADRLQVGRIYLIADPSGNLVASYPAEVEQKELLRDLKRLLSVSGTNR